jgi:hypothetical protein
MRMLASQDDHLILTFIKTFSLHMPASGPHHSELDERGSTAFKLTPSSSLLVLESFFFWLISDAVSIEII